VALLLDRADALQDLARMKGNKILPCRRRLAMPYVKTELLKGTTVSPFKIGFLDNAIHAQVSVPNSSISSSPPAMSCVLVDRSESTPPLYIPDACTGMSNRAGSPKG